MKKLLLFLLLLPFLAKSQIVVPRGTKSVAVEDAYLYTTFGFKIPRYADTTAANLMMGHDSIGLVIQTTTVDGIWHRAHSVGAFNKWVLTGTGSGGGGVDTIFVTQIGVGSPQIPLLYAVDGNLRTARLVPGVFTTPAMNLDSGVHIDLDTTGSGGAAYKQWIINNYGPAGVGGNIYTIDGRLQQDRSVSGYNTHSLALDSLTLFTVNTGAYFISVDNGTTNTQITGDPFHISQEASTDAGSAVGLSSINKDSITFSSTNGTTVQLSLTPTTGRLKGLPHSNDTTARKPVAVGTDGSLVVMDGWAGSGGGGGNGVGRDTVQAYTSGSTLTQSASTNYIQVNPASLQAALTITTLASGGTWHTSNDIYIVFGGTVTSGNPVITSFTFTAGSGMTKVEAVTPSGAVNAGEVIHYHKVGSFLYRIN